MSGGELGVKAFSFGIDKGYDRLPNSMFLTPKERKQRKRELQQQQGDGPGPDQPGQSQQSPQPQSGQGYTQPGAAYNQDSYSQDRGLDSRGDRGYSGQDNSRQAINDDPYWNQEGQAMQTDGYYPSGGGRRAYNPADYEPRYNDYGDGYGRDSYGMSSSRDPYNRPSSAGRVDRYRPQSYQADSRTDSYDDYQDDYDRRGSRRSRSSKSKSNRSRSRSGLRGQLDKRFDRSERGLTSGALGALAGGLVGHEVGKGPLATVAGVVLGGLGANAFEARHERNKDRDAQAFGGRRSKSTDARGGGYEKEEYYGRSRGTRGQDRDYDDSDSYDSEEDRSPRRLTGSGRKEKRREQRKKDEEREEMEKHFGWGHTLHS